MLDESHEREQILRQDLNNSRAEVLRVTRMYNDALNDERNARQNLQGEINKHRRAIHRWTVRYNNDTERWRRRHGGCIQQARNWKRLYQNSDIQNQQLNAQLLIIQNNPIQTTMAGYPPPRFAGRAEDDLDDFIKKLSFISYSCWNCN